MFCAMDQYNYVTLGHKIRLKTVFYWVNHVISTLIIKETEDWITYS